MMNELEIRKLKEELNQYKTAYNLFMDYFEQLDDDSKEELDKDLSQVGL